VRPSRCPDCREFPDSYHAANHRLNDALDLMTKPAERWMIHLLLRIGRWFR
jgi:hypothetical protein